MADVRVDGAVHEPFMQVVIDSLISDFGEQRQVGNSDLFQFVEIKLRLFDARLGWRLLLRLILRTSSSFDNGHGEEWKLCRAEKVNRNLEIYLNFERWLGYRRSGVQERKKTMALRQRPDQQII